MGPYSVTVTTAKASTEVPWGGIAWTNPGDASIDTGGAMFASVTLGPLEISEYINAAQFGPIPLLNVHDTVTGVACTIVAQSTDTDTYMTECWLTDTEVQQGSSVAATKPLESSYKDNQAGGNGEMWGLTSTQLKTLLTQKFFGFQFWLEDTAGAGCTADVSGMSITIWWTSRARLKSLLGAGLGIINTFLMALIMLNGPLKNVAIVEAA